VSIEYFNPCNECHECCNGNLIGNAHGNNFGQGKKCLFLVDKLCTIYENRPDTCKKFQCAWSQKLFDDENMRPDKSGLLISVEYDSDNKQFLKVIQTKDLVEYKYYKEVEKFCESNNTYFRLQRKRNPTSTDS